MSLSTEDRLRETYGEFLSVKDLMQIFHYKSAQALRKAHAEGRFPVRLNRFPNRKELFATAGAVARFIDKFEEVQS